MDEKKVFIQMDLPELDARIRAIAHQVMDAENKDYMYPITSDTQKLLERLREVNEVMDKKKAEYNKLASHRQNLLTRLMNPDPD